MAAAEELKEMARKLVEMNIDKAWAFIQTGDIDNPAVYSMSCLNLGSTIDSAIVMEARPSLSHLAQLVLIVKEVCRRKAESLEPSLMMLMLHVKSACQIGWFSDEARDCLLMMAKKVSFECSNSEKNIIEPSNGNFYVSDIISRFYPRMRVEHILDSFDVKAGHGPLVTDFYISPDMIGQNLWLLVARTDNMDTAASLVSPSNVDFLINHIGVPKRTRNNMGKGPQLPSNVTDMIKCGANFLQVLGDFNGQYIIALAVMSLITSPDPSQLRDYIQPVPSEAHPDCDITEVLSPVSLDCPISERRIRTPVKGHLCKHHQCFDYSYFMEMNFIRPTWKCPVCDKPICNLDIRLDQNFLKILNEVADNVTDLIISDDGSWMIHTTDKSQTPETNMNTMRPENHHVPDTTPNFVSVEANDMAPMSSPALHDIGGSAINLTVKCPSTFEQPCVTAPAVPPPPVVKDFSLMSQHRGQSQDNVCATSETRGTTLFTIVRKHRRGHNQQKITGIGQSELDPTSTPTPTLDPTAASNIRPVSPTQFPDELPSGRMMGGLIGKELDAAQLKFCAPPRQPTCAAKPLSRLTSTTIRVRRTALFSPVHLTPDSAAPALKKLGGQTQAHMCTTGKDRGSTFLTHAKKHGSSRKKRKNTVLGQPHLDPDPSLDPTPASNVRPVSPTRLPQPSEDELSFGKMRGGLTGKQLEAARLAFLAPPKQPICAEEPWSPTSTLPTELLMKQPLTSKVINISP